jgi:hypothetical protein
VAQISAHLCDWSFSLRHFSLEDWRRVVLGAAYQQKTDQNVMTRESGFFVAGSTPCLHEYKLVMPRLNRQQQQADLYPEIRSGCQFSVLPVFQFIRERTFLQNPFGPKR